jgi:hypothetical protein
MAARRRWRLPVLLLVLLLLLLGLGAGPAWAQEEAGGLWGWWVQWRARLRADTQRGSVVTAVVAVPTPRWATAAAPEPALMPAPGAHSSATDADAALSDVRACTRARVCIETVLPLFSDAQLIWTRSRTSGTMRSWRPLCAC